MPTIHTTIPHNWRGLTLYDWGTKGLRAHGNIMRAAGPGRRPRKTFDDRWLRDLGRLRAGDPGTTRRLKRLTDEVWPVKTRRGRFWQTEYYLAPKPLIQAAKAGKA